jgi:hypothetical protein
LLETFCILETLLLMALLTVWGLVGIAANGRNDSAVRQIVNPWWNRAVRLGARTGILLVLLWCCNTAVIYFSLGWHFVMDRLLVMLPLLLLPALLVIAVALPALNGHKAMTPASAANAAASVHTSQPACCWCCIWCGSTFPPSRI